MKHIIFVIITLVIMCVGIFVPRKITNHDDLKNFKCGLPFAFITVDNSYRDSPLPSWWDCGNGEYGDMPIDYNVFNFLLSFAVVYGCVYFVFRLGRRAIIMLSKQQRNNRTME